MPQTTSTPCAAFLEPLQRGNKGENSYTKTTIVHQQIPWFQTTNQINIVT